MNDVANSSVVLFIGLTRAVPLALPQRKPVASSTSTTFVLSADQRSKRHQAAPSKGGSIIPATSLRRADGEIGSLIELRCEASLANLDKLPTALG